MITITLADTYPPSHNLTWAGVHWGNRRALADQMRWHMAIEAKAQYPGLRIVNQVDILITAYAGRGQRAIDADNIEAKSWIDGLVDVGILKNDSPKYVRTVSLRTIDTKEETMTVIEIREVESG